MTNHLPTVTLTVTIAMSRASEANVLERLRHRRPCQERPMAWKVRDFRREGALGLGWFWGSFRAGIR